MAAADLDTINSTQSQGVQYLGLIYQALKNGIVNWQPVPATAASAGTAGMVAYDANFLYLCVSTNVWKRVAISTF
jgi:hypothetical protein